MERMHLLAIADLANGAGLPVPTVRKRSIIRRSPGDEVHPCMAHRWTMEEVDLNIAEKFAETRFEAAGQFAQARALSEIPVCRRQKQSRPALSGADRL